jgi:predicted DNA-binding transcriptional regulator YafY
MRADRLLAILLLLQAGRQLTARELARRLEVSQRTIYRDLDALSMAGVPIYAESGPGGGVRLMEGYHTDLTGLTDAEAEGLLMAGAPGPLTDLGFGQALEGGYLKLLAALPTARRQAAERARQRLFVETGGWFRAADVTTHLATAQAAVWYDRRLHLVYRRGTGERDEPLVDAYGLVCKAGVWYLVGAAAGTVRVFRVSRIQAATLDDDHFDRPPDFDLAAFWTAWRARFEASLPHEYAVVLRAAPEFAPVLRREIGDDADAVLEQAGPPDRDGWRRLSLTFENDALALSRVLGFGTLVEVLEPRDLRESVAGSAAGVVALYARSVPG